MTREELIEELTQKGVCFSLENVETLADWVIADRARICAPLVKVQSAHEGYHNVIDGYEEKNEAINEALQLAGIQEKELK